MNSARTIDLNADLGEHDGHGYAADNAMLDVVSSANIACGAHAGSKMVMETTVKAAHDRGVSIGAHPSYPDREGFGRVETGLRIDDIIASMRDQIEALSRCCTAQGARLSYVKPHGALYNRASRDVELARAIAECVAQIDSTLTMLALSGSSLAEESRNAGLNVAREAFIDRAYKSDGMLVPRHEEGAVIADAAAAAERAVGIAKDHRITAIDGSELNTRADSLCVHGDSPDAIEIVTAARKKLESLGFTIAPFAR
ncbi:MAG: LamB/YcsF family protein [Thermoanaerobaculia bacterium]